MPKYFWWIKPLSVLNWTFVKRKPASSVTNVWASKTSVKSYLYILFAFHWRVNPPPMKDWSASNPTKAWLFLMSNGWVKKFMLPFIETWFPVPSCGKESPPCGPQNRPCLWKSPSMAPKDHYYNSIGVKIVKAKAEKVTNLAQNRISSRNSNFEQKLAF